MTRLARVVAPGMPHHITQRGTRRQETFFRAEDYELYLRLMAEFCREHGVEIWSYCLMPNHVHLIAIPKTEDALRLAIGRAHRRYAMHVNARGGWTGHLWQGRFASFVMDEPYLLAAARYIEMNPVRAGMVARPWDYPWSSARAHVEGRNDVLVKELKLLELVPDWRVFLETALSEDQARKLKEHESTGRPLGGKDFISLIEARTGRRLMKQKAGRKAKRNLQPDQDSMEEIGLLSPNL